MVNIVQSWSVDPVLPFWQAKRAGILAELGLVTEAKKILEEALINIRFKINSSKADLKYYLLSQESYVMLLSSYISSYNFSSKENSKRENNIKKERLHALKQYKCDPYLEFQLFSKSLQHRIDDSKICIKEEFDIGKYTRTSSYDYI